MPHGIEYRLQIQMYIKKENELSTFTVQIWSDYAHSFDGSIARHAPFSYIFTVISSIFWLGKSSAPFAFFSVLMFYKYNWFVSNGYFLAKIVVR